jgi:aspartate aminotransferase-like enzyme
MLLLIPGPVQTRPEVRAAMAQDIAPWDRDFQAVYARIRSGVAARAGLVRRLREASGGAMIALGLGLALARRPAS